MLQSLFRRAEASVDNAIAGVLGRVLIAIPFIGAAAFATASATIYLNDQLGPAGGTLAMAAAFCLIGLITAGIVSYRMAEQPAGSTSQPMQAGAHGHASEDAPLIDTADKELVSDVLKSVVPMAIPMVLRLAVKNLPLVAAAAAASFILSRGKARDGAAMQPAE